VLLHIQGVALAEAFTVVALAEVFTVVALVEVFTVVALVEVFTAVVLAEVFTVVVPGGEAPALAGVVLVPAGAVHGGEALAGVVVMAGAGLVLAGAGVAPAGVGAGAGKRRFLSVPL